ncbi:MFS transporter [Tessaracoccus aquimaris]|uniref:MFS transporter n=1 Tax=Tessaracoccus aquimaris TaxID=1332264 RepID=UPI001D056273|nr:MFS transporter [Tessaracoccus aquimaris]
MTASRQRGWLRVVPSIFMLAWGGNHFTPLLHLYEEVGHYAPWQANLLLGMYVAGLIPGLLLLAPVSDQHGRRPALIAGAVASVAGSVLLACGFQSFALLCLGRVLAGVAVGPRCRLAPVGSRNSPLPRSTRPPGRRRGLGERC